MLSVTLFVVSALVVAASAGPLPNPQVSYPINPLVEYGNANFYIDLVLYNINRQLPTILPLGDIGGPFDMTNCFFLGLEYGITRDGDATLITIGNEVKFAMQLKMRETGIKCNWHYLFNDGEVTAITPYVSMASGMIFIIDHGQHPWLTQFTVTTMDPIDVQMTGIFGLNWLAEDIANWVLKGAQDEITMVIETTVRTVIQEILNTMVLP